MYSDILGELGLTKNEAKIYETLLRHGESSVATISTEAGINRRNVYDTLDRLIEKGLIFEIRAHNENAYQAVDPVKLMEKIQEKEQSLKNVLPEMEKLYRSKPHDEGVYIYRGAEGWKNIMRETIRMGEDEYVIGGKGTFADPKLKTFLTEWFIPEAEKKNIVSHVLFDHEVKEQDHEILKILESNHKFLPEGFSTSAVAAAAGNRVVITTSPEGKIGEIDENTSFTVIKNRTIADAFRTWHQLLWEHVPQKGKKKVAKRT